MESGLAPLHRYHLRMFLRRLYLYIYIHMYTYIDIVSVPYIHSRYTTDVNNISEVTQTTRIA